MNECTGYSDFCDRVRAIEPASFSKLSRAAKEAVLKGAWEECAWIPTLTDQRILAAMFGRMPLY